jgi:hypothetical protein
MKLLAAIFFGVLTSYVSSNEFSFDAEKEIEFYLVSKNQSDKIFTMASSDLVRNSSYMPSKPTVFLVHGYFGNRHFVDQIILSK